MNFELFAPTVDNRFIFSLFEFLLSGVIALVNLKAWRTRAAGPQLAGRGGLLPASILLSLSLAYGTFWTGIRFLFGVELAEPPFLLASHICLAAAWLLIALQVRKGSEASLPPNWILGLCLAGCSLIPLLVAYYNREMVTLFSLLARLLDGANLLILGMTVYLLRRWPGRANQIFTTSLCLFLVAAGLHLPVLDVVSFPFPTSHMLIWNLGQLSFSSGLLLLALAIGEMSTNLFDTVFIRIHIAFILLASLILLVLTATERSEYLQELKNRTHSLGVFLAAGLEDSARRGETLAEALEREDLLARLTTDFGNLPELVAVRLAVGGEKAAFAINAQGVINKIIGEAMRLEAPRLEDRDRYFRIASFPLNQDGGMGGAVELYGFKEYLDRYSRRRIILIFALFTGVVLLATLMIGFVLGQTERTLREQEKMIRAREAELAMASKMPTLGQLAGSVAHEVNTPATTILSRGSYLLKRWKREGASSDEQEDLATITEQARRIAQITSSLLGFSRRHTLEISPVSVCEVIDKSSRLVEEELRSASIALTVQGCPCPHLVAGDKNSLTEAFLNLFKNAMDAMPAGGSIRIEVEPDAGGGSSLLIHFTDTGVGIPPEHLSEIFVPFFTTKQMGKGTGLGLSVVYGIISEHKGSIRVESHAGKGTTFHIELPCRE